jgi:hypothetical protein
MSDNDEGRVCVGDKVYCTGVAKLSVDKLRDKIVWRLQRGKMEESESDVEKER